MATHGMAVRPCKAVSGNTLYEVHYGEQTLSEPFANRADANWYMFYLARVKGTEKDPLADYWKRVEG